MTFRQTDKNQIIGSKAPRENSQPLKPEKPMAQAHQTWMMSSSDWIARSCRRA
jgi:hypothetical protein